MIFKERTPSVLLRKLRVLNKRIELSEDDVNYYLYQEKGFEGEVRFDKLTERLKCDCLILNDLLLEFNNTTFQIDTLIIFQNTIYLIDVKYHEGEHIYDSGDFKKVGGNLLKNPIDQLKRCTTLLKQLLQSIGYTIPIEAYVVFNNPNFTLFHAPLNLPMILPTQLSYFLKKLEVKPSKLNSLHKKLAEKLVSLHQTESSYSKIPSYNYQQLKKGVSCKQCGSFSVTVQGRKFVCSDCRSVEEVELGVMRSVEELLLLFPDIKITTNLVHEWCGVVESKKRIYRILERHFSIKNVRKWQFFERK